MSSGHQVKFLDKSGEEVVVSESTPLPIVFGDKTFVDRELLTTLYKVKTAFTGASVGDGIRKVDTLDVSTDVVITVSVGWTNITTGLDLASTPTLSNLEAISQGDSLTLAQLTAAGLATATNQVTQIGYLADLAEANDRYGDYKLVQTEDLGAGTKYVQKSNGTKWLMIKKTYTDSGSKLSYASAVNNAGVTEAQAWTNRAALTYSAIGAV